MKYLKLLLRFCFVAMPLTSFFAWQLVIAHPRLLVYYAPVSIILLLGAVYEASGRKISLLAGHSFIVLGLLFGSFLLFISLLLSSWFVFILWMIIIWHLYRSFFAIRRQSKLQESDWSRLALYGGLVTIFLMSSCLFGLQSFLSLSPWPMLAVFLPLAFLNTFSVAYSQGWYNKQDFILWIFLAVVITETAMMIALLPLNYLVAGILTALAYYSILNFARLYLNGGLTRRKIKNYALFTAISLIIIFLTARWL